MKPFTQLLLAATLLAAAQPAMPNDLGGPNGLRARLIARVVELTNQERAAHGLKPLQYDTRLEAAAQWMAEDMGRNSYVGHTDSFGRSIAQRVPTFGFNRYRILRENLAGGHRSPEEVVTAWMNSPGHRANILCRKCTHIGIGFHYEAKSRHGLYWVQEFGAE